MSKPLSTYGAILHLVCNLVKEDVKVCCATRIDSHLSPVEKGIAIPSTR